MLTRDAWELSFPFGSATRQPQPEALSDHVEQGPHVPSLCTALFGGGLCCHRADKEQALSY